MESTPILNRFELWDRNSKLCPTLIFAGTSLLGFGAYRNQDTAIVVGVAMQFAALLIGIVFALSVRTEDGPPVDAGEVEVLYRNWEGEQRTRTLRPLRLYFGSNQWHPVPQWLLEAEDMETGTIRSFALSGIANPESFVFHVPEF